MEHRLAIKGNICWYSMDDFWKHYPSALREKVTWGHSEKAVVYKQKREASGEVQPPYTLDVQFPEPWENKSFLFEKQKHYA